MSVSFSKTGLHPFPYVYDLRPGDVEQIPLDLQGQSIATDPEAVLVHHETGAVIETNPPSAVQAPPNAVVTVVAPDVPGMYSLSVTFTGSGPQTGRIWSIILGIRVIDR